MFTVKRPIVPSGDVTLTYSNIALEYWSQCEFNLFVTSVGGLVPFDGTDYDGWVRTSTKDIKTSPTVDGVTFGKIDVEVILEPYQPAAADRSARSLVGGRLTRGHVADSDSGLSLGQSQDMAETVAASITSWQQLVFMFGAINVALLSIIVAMRRSQMHAPRKTPGARQRRFAGQVARPRVAMSVVILGLIVQLALSASAIIDIAPIVCDAACYCDNFGLVYCQAAGLPAIPALPGNTATQTVNLVDNSIRSVVASDFSPTARSEAVRVLLFDGNPITMIGPNAMAHMTRLEHLSLSHTSLRMLAPDVLWPFPLLNEFDASGTFLGHVWLATGPFWGLDELRTVNFSNVDPPLLGINSAMFSNGSLRILDVSQNIIEVVAGRTFAGMRSTEISRGADRQLTMSGNPSVCEINASSLDLSCQCADNSTGPACGSGTPCDSDSTNFELAPSAVGSRQCSGQHCWTPVEPVAGTWCPGATNRTTKDLDICSLGCPPVAQAGSTDVANGTYAPNKAVRHAICLDGTFRPLDNAVRSTSLGDVPFFPYCDYVYASCDAIPPSALPPFGTSRPCGYPSALLDKCPGPVSPDAGMYNNSCAPSADAETCGLECPSEPPDQPSGAFNGVFVPTTFGVAQCMDGQWRSPDYAAPVNHWSGKLPHCEYEYASCADAPPSVVPDAGTPRRCEICSSRNHQPVQAITFRWVTSSSDRAVVWFSADHSYNETAEPGGTVTVLSISVTNDEAFSSYINLHVAGSPQQHVVQASCEDTPSTTLGPGRQGLLAIGDVYGFDNGKLVVVGFDTSAGRNQASCAAAAAPEPGAFPSSCSNVLDLDVCVLECPPRPVAAAAIYLGQFQPTGYGLGACVDGVWKTPDYMVPEPQLDGYGAMVSLWDAKLPHCEYVYASCDQVLPAPDGVPAYVAAPTCEICGPYHALHPEIDRITVLTLRWDLHSPSSGNSIEVRDAANSGIGACAAVNLAHGDEITLAVTVGAPLPVPVCDVFRYSGSKVKPATLVFRLVGGGTDCANTPPSGYGYAPTSGGADCTNNQSGYASVTGSRLSAGPFASASCGSTISVISGCGNEEAAQGDMLTVHDVRASTTCTVSDSNGGQQTITIHTSGSKPLALGDRFGGLELVGFTDAQGTSSSEFCPHPAIRATNRATGEVADLDTSCWTTLAIGDGLNFTDGDLTITGFTMSSGRSESQCPAHSAAFYPDECAGSEDGSLCALQCPEYAGEYSSSVASGNFILTGATSDLHLRQCWDGEWEYAFHGTAASLGPKSWRLGSGKSSAAPSTPTASECLRSIDADGVNCRRRLNDCWHRDVCFDGEETHDFQYWSQAWVLVAVAYPQCSCGIFTTSSPSAQARDEGIVSSGDDRASFCEFVGVPHAEDHTMSPTTSPPTNTKKKSANTRAKTNNFGGRTTKQKKGKFLDDGTPKGAKSTDGDGSTGTEGASGSSPHAVGIGLGVGVPFVAFAIGLTWWMRRDQADGVAKADSEHYDATIVDWQMTNSFATTSQNPDATAAEIHDATSTEELVWN